ncbi:helix-turn-helix domain-containing protein [Streptomyces sp. NPDC051677]|uniref:helix-turn-helix domain-containing protein n=1 Tax=Streptomyces sp. NPDC051677 TaxID=3365669 RepID=UPI0037D46D5A
MSEAQRRPRPSVTYGPTAEAVAANVKRLRERHNMTIYALSAALGDADRPITPSAVAKIERMERQVTVDDLAALAITLGVSPSALLVRRTLTPDESVGVTGVGDVPALAAWDWADGLTPLIYDPRSNPNEQYREYELLGRPGFLAPLRSARQAYTREQLEEYRTEGHVRGTYEWDRTDGKPRWKNPPKTEGESDG